MSAAVRVVVRALDAILGAAAWAILTVIVGILWLAAGPPDRAAPDRSVSALRTANSTTSTSTQLRSNRSARSRVAISWWCRANT